jgi:hypothetical protein
MLDHATTAHEPELDLACDEIGRQLRVPAVGHRHRLESGHEREILHAEMSWRAGAAVGIADWLFLRVGYEVRHRIDWDGWMHDQHVGAARTEREEAEVNVWIEWKLFVEAWVDGECSAERDQECVPVGSGSGDGFGTQIAGCARPILNDNRLLKAC